MKSTERMISILTATKHSSRRAVFGLLRSRGLAFHRKALCAMTLAAGMTMGSTGCVSSTPGSLFTTSSRPSQEPITTDRLVSVARVFETQQNYGKAKQLYKLVLSQQPSNTEAIEQIAWIDSLGTGIPVQNPRLGIPGAPAAAPPQMYAEANYPPPAPVAQAAPPQRFAPQSIEEVTKSSRGPAIPVVMSGTDPSTGQPYLLDSTGQLPTITAAPLTVVEEQISSVDMMAPVAVQVEYPVDPVDTVEVSTFAEPVGMATLGAGLDEGAWAMPVSGQQTAPVLMPEDNSVPLEVEHPIEQLSGTFEEPFAGDSMTSVVEDSQLGAIEKYVDNPEESIPQLVEFLSHSDSDVRSLAAFLIGETTWQGASALPSLNRQLQTEEHEVIRITVAEAIAKIDSQSRDAFVVMAECLDSDDVEIRSQAAFALRVYAAAGHPECVGRLADCLSDSDTNVRSMAALSLGDFGTTAADAIPALEAALSDDSADVRDAASAALTRIKQ